MISTISQESRKGRLKPTILGALATFLLMLGSVTGLAQIPDHSTPERSNEDKAEIACFELTFSLVLVEVEVKDRLGNFVSGLTHRDFLVYEDRNRQQIAFLSAEEILETGIFPLKYTIGYSSLNGKRDGTVRSIRVKVRGAKQQGITVGYYPERYVAPNQ